MFKPAGSDTPVTHFISRQLFQHFHFGTGMTEHIHKIVNDHIRSLPSRLWILLVRSRPAWLFSTFGRKLSGHLYQDALAVPWKNSSSCRFFPPCSSSFFHCVGNCFSISTGSNPEKIGIAGILCCRRQNTVKVCFFQYAKTLCKNGCIGFPLIKPEVVYQYKNKGVLFPGAAVL